MATEKQVKGKTRASYAHTTNSWGMDARLRERQNQAEVRQNKHNGLTPKQKLEKLDKKLGPGVGAVKERARLNKEIREAKF